MDPISLPPGGPTLIQLPSEDNGFAQTLTRWARTVVRAFNLSLSANAPTAGRPTVLALSYLPSAGVGYSMFDTDLGIPIWWKGSGWVNSAGAPV